MQSGSIRLLVTEALRAGAAITPSAAQAHYLGTVMRQGAGDALRLFNGEDGEWLARIAAIRKDKATLTVESQLRPQAPEPDLWLVFAPLKRDATDFLVQKATELGAAALLPVFTERTNTARINLDRLRAIAIEAAEQCERLSVPEIRPAVPLATLLATWLADRALFAALERDATAPLFPAKGPAALLIGPEGGFSQRDRTHMKRTGACIGVSLGPRILRAETAAIVGLALLQGPGCR
jgi:16S rRNA (uracil1498-N3)-methyltransferase